MVRGLSRGRTLVGMLSLSSEVYGLVMGIGLMSGKRSLQSSSNVKQCPRHGGL
jgi:hypothetical protein